MIINSSENFEIKKLTSFKIGAEISRVYFPTNIDEFTKIIQKEPRAVVLGNLSNVLISDSGYCGAVILTKEMNEITINGSLVTAQCGVKGQKLAQEVAKAGLSGLEFLIGFPGSVGGEVFMNASANGQAISDNFVKATCYSNERGIFELTKEEMKFGYRTSVLQDENIKIFSAEFELIPLEVEKINARMAESLNFRHSHQPKLSLPSCGSVFKNPPLQSAGKLLDECGVKGLIQGGVKVWENHANFIVNYNNGTSLDVLELMQKMANLVYEKFNIKLEPEIIFLGGNNEREEELCKILYQKTQK